MIFKEENRDLFKVDESYYLAHCVATDIRMGAGIAVSMNAKFGLRKQLQAFNQSDLLHPTCILTGRVFNLITKSRSYGKPTVSDFLSAMWIMRDIAVQKDVGKIAMPRIGCGLDGLKWIPVRDAIKKAFSETGIEILVCVWG